VEGITDWSKLKMKKEKKTVNGLQKEEINENVYIPKETNK